jgi:radical SAM protein (TIGR01212 family)
MTNEELEIAVDLLRKHNIEVVLHIINGLPNETENDMLETINYVNKLDIQGIKIHSLLILNDTIMADEYNKNPFKILSLNEYVDITVKQICNLRPDIIIHRLAADGNIKDLIEPKWTIKKMVVMNEIDKKMRKEGLYQGMNYEKD